MTRVHARAHLDLLLLAAIRGEPGDGAAVMRELRTKSGGRFSLSSGSIYPALHRLERNRLIRRGRDRPRHYLLTEEGQRSLAAREAEWSAFQSGVDALLAARDGRQS